MVYKPTDRERQRYITYTGTSPLPVFQQLFGAMGIAAAGIQQLAENKLRVNADHVDRVKAAICLTPGSRSIKVTGSLNASVR